jgi:ATP-dependent Clp protease ATP-binding subunit ClpC
LFDEIEKAHPEVFNVLLQVLEDGRLTDGKGRTVDFRNTIIIMTSNVGASTIRKNSRMGFAVGDTAKEDYEHMKQNVMEELKKTFRPEFLNRIDDVIVFHPLKEEHLQEIVSLMVEELRKRLKEQDIDFRLTDEAKKHLAKQGFDPSYGARPLRRAIQKHIEDRLSEELLKGAIKRGDSVVIGVRDGSLTVEKENVQSSEAR